MVCHKRRLAIAGQILLGTLLFAVSIHAQESTSPLTSLKRLVDGNERFVAGKPNPKDYIAERVLLAEGQHPYAIIVTCADSRLSPELLFDESLGKLFVVRTAGHVVDPVVLGSVEYAAEHLHVNLIFFLGHESCGAVKAAIAGGEFSSNVGALASRIRPAVDKAINRGVADKDLLNVAIAENVKYQISMALFQSDPLKHMIAEQKVSIAGGVYSLRSGRVQVIESTISTLHTEKNGSSVTESLRTPRSGEKKTTEETKHDSQAPKTPKKKTSLEDYVRNAFEGKLTLELRKPMLMRDTNDRCFFDDCRKIPAGEKVTIESPLILTIMGRQQFLVSYKGQRVYVLADPEAFEYVPSAKL